LALDENKIEPLNNNVLVRLIQPKDVFEGSRLVKPDSVKAEENFCTPLGKVIAVGPGARSPKTGHRLAIDIPVGKTVRLRKHIVEPLFPNDQNLVMIDAAMVLAVMETGAAE
jgi:co-chaperonin GroES (HSP10)